MHVGDLVDFHTGAWVFENASKDYANPGIILKEMPSHNNEIKASKKFEVYWADGRVTIEHDCYVRPARESNGSR